jgi:TRAP-type C4-dicarboxylate transport system substrate-binding protein
MKSFALSLLAAAAAMTTGMARADTVFTVSSWLAPTHTASMAQKEWCDLLEKNTAGKMKCNFLPRGVTAAPGTYDAVKNGLADISFTVHGYTPGRFVYTQMAEMPFLGNKARSPCPSRSSRIAAKHPEFTAEHQGGQGAGLLHPRPRHRVQHQAPDRQGGRPGGLKFRVGGGMVNEISKSLGMNVTLKPAPDSYELLSTGVMDGTLFPAESTESFKIDKIIKHATTFPGGLYNTSFVFMMNQAKYDKLTADEKKAVDAISGETAARIFGRGWDKVDTRALALMQANGVVVTKADAKFVADVKAKTAPLEQAWIKSAEAKGMKNPAKVLAEFRAEIAKLEK